MLRLKLGFRVYGRCDLRHNLEHLESESQGLKKQLTMLKRRLQTEVPSRELPIQVIWGLGFRV